MGFLGHNSGSRHARRSSKGSIDAGDHLVSNNVWSKFLAHWIGVQGPSNLVKKPKTPPLWEPLPGEPLTQIKKKIFNRTKKTCRIRKGLEQLSSYSGWRVITKNLEPIYWLVRSLKSILCSTTQSSVKCEDSQHFVSRNLWTVGTAIYQLANIVYFRNVYDTFYAISCVPLWTEEIIAA